MTLESGAAEQFAIGPCVLAEYRNRGLGTSLLAASLDHLRALELSRANAITRKARPLPVFSIQNLAGKRRWLLRLWPSKAVIPSKKTEA